MLYYVRAVKDNQTAYHTFYDQDEADRFAGELEASGWTVFIY